MCGIFGITISPSSSLSSNEIKSLIIKIFLLSERRGKDASGLLSILSSRINVLKSPMRASHLIKSNEFKKIIKVALQNYDLGESFSFLGHTRMVTGGTEHLNYNNQPVIKDKASVVHNGIIVNEHDILTSRNLSKNYDVDSEILISLFNENLEKGHSHSKAFQMAINIIKGANTFALCSTDSDEIFLHSSNKSLYLFHDQNLKISVFSSEKNVLESTLEKLSHKSNRIDHKSIIYSDNNEIYSINYETSRLKKLTRSALVESEHSDRLFEEKTEKIIQEYEVKNTRYLNQKLIINDYKNVEKNIALEQDKIDNLTRCSKCVLPSTFPDILFDDA